MMRNARAFPIHYWELLDELNNGNEVELSFATEREARSTRARLYAFTAQVRRDYERIVAGKSPLDEVWQRKVRDCHDAACNLTSTAEGAKLRVFGKHLTKEAGVFAQRLVRPQTAPQLPAGLGAKPPIEPPEWMKRLALVELPDGTQVPWDDPRARAARNEAG
jgi:hypothetical protein